MRENARVLLVTWDGAGNLPPELSLLEALVARGHTAYAIGHDSLREALESRGAECLPLRGALPYDSKVPMPPEQEMPFVLEHVWFGEVFGAALLEAVEQVRPDVLLVDSSLAPALVAARSTGLPTVALCHFPYRLILGAFSPVLESFLPKTNEYATRLGLDPFPSHRALIETTPLVLVSSYRPFDGAATDSRSVMHVGPCRGAGHGAEPWKRRSSDRPLVVVGMSTSHQHQVPVLQRLCDALGTLEVEALVTTGPAIAPETLAPAANTTVARLVSHDAVLPQADLLVTHAGHGTVMAGVTYGTPMLCMPMGRDQPFIAERVAELGLGSVIDPAAEVADLAQAIAKILADGDVKRRAADFARSLAGHAGLADAVGLIEGLLTYDRPDLTRSRPASSSSEQRR